MTSILFHICVLAMSTWNLVSSGVELAGTIIKPKKDKRQYRGFTLENGIKTVVVSDPKAVKAAVALAVRVGYLSDPDDIPGMAHFCEHMLSMGSDKYPEENYLDKLLKDHGGESQNAETVTDMTTYYFSVGAEYLDKTIDPFSRFFIAPLFRKSAVDRETNAVNSEYYGSLRNDVYRVSRIYQVVSNPNHSYRMLDVGTRETLYDNPKAKGIEPHKEVRKFWERWYSSNIMTLAIYGKETLAELQDYAVKYFSEIENKKIETPSWESPFVPTTLKKWINIETLQQTNGLTFNFPIKDLDPLYRSAPELYIEYILGSKGPDSLTAWLKQKGWAHSVEVSSATIATGFSKMSIAVELTNDGESHIEEIGQALFQVIDMIRKEGPQKRIFDEEAKLGELSFQNQAQGSAIKTVKKLVETLFRVPLTEVLQANFKLYEYTPDEISMLLKDLNPENMFVFRLSDKFNSSQLERKEKYYNVSYSVKPISTSMMKTFRDPGKNKYFKLPPANPYIPDTTDLKPKDKCYGNVPELIQSDDLFHVWYYQDKEYQAPKGHLWIMLISPVANVDPYYISMKSVLAMLIGDALETPLAAAAEAGLTYQVLPTTSGFIVRIIGYPEKQEELVKNILKQIVVLKIDPRRLKNIRESYVQNLNNLNAAPGKNRALSFLFELSIEKNWNWNQLLRPVKDITEERLGRYRKLLLSRLHVDIFGSGNYVRNDLLRIAKITKEILTDGAETVAVDPETITTSRSVKLFDGENSLFQKPHPVEFNTEFLNFYECGEPTMRNELIARLIANIIHQPMFDQLRTKEQLGYAVQAYPIKFDGSVGNVLQIGSEKDPVYLENRTESFLAGMAETLASMTVAQFEQQKDALATDAFKRPNSLLAKSKKFWNEILERQYNFEKTEQEKSVLEKITLNEFVEAFNKRLSPKSKERKRLHVWVIGSSSSGSGYELESACNGEMNCIDDPAAFRRNHALAPCPKPYLSFKEMKSKYRSNCRHRPAWLRYG